jgi:hypothetical protein
VGERARVKLKGRECVNLLKRKMGLLDSDASSPGILGGELF